MRSTSRINVVEYASSRSSDVASERLGNQVARARRTVLVIAL